MAPAVECSHSVLHACKLTIPLLQVRQALSSWAKESRQSWIPCYWLAVGQVTPSNEAGLCIVIEVRAALPSVLWPVRLMYFINTEVWKKAALVFLFYGGKLRHRKG